MEFPQTPDVQNTDTQLLTRTTRQVSPILTPTDAAWTWPQTLESSPQWLWVRFARRNPCAGSRRTLFPAVLLIEMDEGASSWRGSLAPTGVGRGACDKGLAVRTPPADGQSSGPD